ncbi:MAG: hypothetical protein AAFV19_07075 [Pseudomonadota bacterium]
MSEQTPAKPSGNPPANAVQIIWILYLASIVIGLAGIVGVIWAYVARGETTEADWEHSHFTFQIRTFWIGMLFIFIGIVLAFVLIGFLVLLAVLIWLVVRSVKGLQAHGNQAPIPNPQTWLW